MENHLVGGDWNMAFMTFYLVGNVIIPTDELIFFRGVGIPPTSYLLVNVYKKLWKNDVN